MMPRVHRLRRLIALATALSFVPLGADARISTVATPAPAATTSTTEAASTPAPSTEGDLSHLTFTATTNLTAAFVKPENGSRVGAATPVEVATGPGGGVELSVNGIVVPFTHIGLRLVSKLTGETHFTYYGITFKPGPNAVTITPLGADGLRGNTVRATMFGAEPGTTLHASISGQLRAGSNAKSIIHVSYVDRSNKPAAPEQIRATVVSGDVTLGEPLSANTSAVPSYATIDSTASTHSRTPTEPPTSLRPDANPAPFGTVSSLPAVPNSPQTISNVRSGSKRFEGRSSDSGLLDIPITPGLQAGDTVIRIEAAGASITLQTYVLPYLRPALVTGLVSGGIGSIPGNPGEDLSAANGVNSKRSRVALFASGSVLEKALLTFAYDTADVLDQTSSFGAFTANPDERPYLTYGDASTRRDDALSRDHLYARLESGRASFTWGEFQAKTGSDTQAAIGGLDLLVNGAKFDAATSTSRVTLFNARNNVAYGRQTFTPTGLSSLLVTLHPEIVVGSDIVDLIALDRRTGAVLSEVTLTQNVDYTLDYGTGQIRFINVPMPFDPEFNPQQLLIRYQYDGIGSDAETTGGRIATTIGKSGSLQVGAGYANSAQGAGNVSLFSQLLSKKIGEQQFNLEHMTTRGEIGATDPFAATSGIGDGGDAWRAAYLTTVRDFKIGLRFDTTSKDYNNPFGGLATPGLMSFRAGVTRVIRGGTLEASIDRIRNVGVAFDNAQSNAKIAVKKRLTHKLAVGVGLSYHHYTAGTSFVGIPSAGQSVNPVPTPIPVPVTNTISNPDGSVTQAAVSAAYKISPAIDVQASRLFDIGGSASAVAALPSQTSAEIGVAITAKGRAYIREMWQGSPNETFAASTVPLTSQASGTHSTAIGIEQSLGSATSVTSQYLMQSTANGSDLYSTIGVKEQIAVAKKLTGSLQIQKANAIGTGLSGFNVYDAALAYSNGTVRTTGAYELRTGDAPGSTLSLGAAGALSPSLSLIAALENVNSVGFTSNRDRVSLAMRPAYDENSIFLLGYEQESGSDSTLGDHTETLSVEYLVRPSHKLELSSRLAYKLDGDAFYAAHTYLLGLRAVQKLGGPHGRFDVGVESRYLGAGGGIAGADAFGYALESGVTVGDTMRVGLGYNFARSPDPNLSVAEKRQGIYATFTSAIDSIFGWGRQH